MLVAVVIGGVIVPLIADRLRRNDGKPLVAG
jgi:hypothetical protein